MPVSKGKGAKKRAPAGASRFPELAEAYFARCGEDGLHPSLPGLALALGLDSRRELEQAAAGGGKWAGAVRRAMTRVEEANIQSAYKKDSAASAKFILQNGFGYAEKPAPPPVDEISVSIVEEDG